jgi:hypothetical protein
MTNQRPTTRRKPPKAKTSQPTSGAAQAAGDSIADLGDELDWLDDPVETLPDLEREIGIADWLDPQTGEPAEGQSPPHLEAE